MGQRKRRLDLVGKIFGRLTVLELLGQDENGKSAWYCQCSCGELVNVRGSHLQDGSTRSCGCLRRESTRRRHKKHGHRSGKQTKVYSAWMSMKDRCYNVNNKAYRYYGGRGVKVCESWVDSFEAFLADMGEPASGDTLDRIDNDGDYTPNNCRWATAKEQARNRRSNRYLTYHGKEQTIAKWAEELGINYNTLRNRLGKLGWDVEKALMTDN